MACLYICIVITKANPMTRITGITIEKDKSGNARYARIDLKKYGKQLSAFFQ